MTLEYVLGGILSVLLIGYLVYALLWPGAVIVGRCGKRAILIYKICGPSRSRKSKKP